MPRVDLLLTDMVMPGMNGAELAAAIRARRPDLRVLFMSAYSDEALIEQGRIQAGVPILEKPFEPDELARRVREVLDDDAA
jgi:CheY-like chemotaxis protein